MSLKRLATLRELSAKWDLRMSWLYERSRRNDLPGMLRLGRHIRVDLDEWDRAVEAGELGGV